MGLWSYWACGTPDPTCGASDAACLIARTAIDQPDYRDVLQQMLQRYRNDLKKRVSTGKLRHCLGTDRLAERVHNLESYTP